MTHVNKVLPMPLRLGRRTQSFVCSLAPSRILRTRRRCCRRTMPGWRVGWHPREPAILDRCRVARARAVAANYGRKRDQCAARVDQRAAVDRQLTCDNPRFLCASESSFLLHVRAVHGAQIVEECRRYPPAHPRLKVYRRTGPALPRRERAAHRCCRWSRGSLRPCERSRSTLRSKRPAARACRLIAPYPTPTVP